MDFHELQLKGQFIIEDVISLPIFINDFIGRVLYVNSTDEIFYGTVDGWIEIPRNVFKNISVSGEDLIVADGLNDTLNIDSINLDLKVNKNTKTILISTGNYFSNISNNDDLIEATKINDDLTLSSLNGVNLLINDKTVNISGDNNFDGILVKNLNTDLYNENINAINIIGPRSSPTLIPFLPYKHLTLGDYHTMGIVSSDIGEHSDKLWAWGENKFGELGTGQRNTSYSSPVSVLGGFDWNYVDISNSIAPDYNKRFHFIGIRDNGSAWGSGDNTWGQLGTNNIISRSSPVSVVGGISFIHVTCGAKYTLGIRGSDGSCWAWGHNGYGKLGDGSMINRSSPVSVRGGISFIQVSVWDDTSIGIRGSDGSAWAWGHNGLFNFGDRTTISRSSPVSVHGGISFTKISCGNDHSAGIRGSDGSLWTWGRNRYGELGDGTVITRSFPISVRGGISFVDVSCGQEYTIGIDSNGTAWAWGYNNNGQLGDGTRTNRSSPVSVLGNIPFKKVYCGLFHTVAIDYYDDYWAWGNNTYGQLGGGFLKTIEHTQVETEDKLIKANQYNDYFNLLPGFGIDLYGYETFEGDKYIHIQSQLTDNEIDTLIVWLYEDVAPEGWEIVDLTSDSLLAVCNYEENGGGSDYSVWGGTQAGTWLQDDHLHTILETILKSNNIPSHFHHLSNTDIFELSDPKIDLSDDNFISYYVDSNADYRFFGSTTIPTIGRTSSYGDGSNNDYPFACIPVIDEDDHMSDHFNKWVNFRSSNPDSLFYLLKPYNRISVRPPTNFVSDDKAFGPIDVNRDNGIVANRSDWFSICNLDAAPYGSTVLLSIDNSGSMRLSTVKASYDYFFQRCSSAGIQIIEVTMKREDWITPFIGVNTQELPQPHGHGTTGTSSTSNTWRPLANVGIIVKKSIGPE